MAHQQGNRSLGQHRVGVDGDQHLGLGLQQPEIECSGLAAVALAEDLDAWIARNVRRTTPAVSSVEPSSMTMISNDGAERSTAVDRAADHLSSL